MKIAVIGAGAMGSLFGAFLCEGGAEVWLMDTWLEQVDTINRRGLRIEREGATRVVPMRAATDPACIGFIDLAIVFVKSTHTAQAAPTAAQLIGERGMVMTLQNGMGNAETIAAIVDPTQVLAGTTSHGATLLTAGSIRHAGVGPTVIGLWHDNKEGGARLGEIAALFTRCGIQTETVEDVRPVLWNKLLVNIGINAVTALCAIKNGQLLDLDVTREVSRAAVEEALSIAQAHGIPTRADVYDHVLSVARATARNRSSMGQDVDNKRPTEIGAINGYIVREAERLGIAAPVNKTLTALVETLQYHYK